MFELSLLRWSVLLVLSAGVALAIVFATSHDQATIYWGNAATGFRSPFNPAAAPQSSSCTEICALQNKKCKLGKWHVDTREKFDAWFENTEFVHDSERFKAAFYYPLRLYTCRDGYKDSTNIPAGSHLTSEDIIKGAPLVDFDSGSNRAFCAFQEINKYMTQQDCDYKISTTDAYRLCPCV